MLKASESHVGEALPGVKLRSNLCFITGMYPAIS